MRKIKKINATIKKMWDINKSNLPNNVKTYLYNSLTSKCLNYMRFYIFKQGYLLCHHLHKSQLIYKLLNQGTFIVRIVREWALIINLRYPI